MNGKIVLIGILTIVVAAAGAVAIYEHFDSVENGGQPSDDITGHWYPIGGEMYIEGLGYYSMTDDDITISGIVNLRIEECRDNVFYGGFSRERIAGVMYDDGRVVFTYTQSNSEEKKERVFDGYYRNGILYGTTALEQRIDGAERLVVMTVAYSQNPYGEIQAKNHTSIQGVWDSYEVSVLSGNSAMNVESVRMIVESKSELGVFAGKFKTVLDGTEITNNLLGTSLMIPLDGKYHGYIYDMSAEKMASIVYDEHSFKVQSIMTDDDMGLISLSTSFSRDGSGTAPEYPDLTKKVYFPYDSTLACNVNDIGKIVKSATPIQLLVTKQDGGSLSGTIKMNGINYPMSGTINEFGEMWICFKLGGVLEYAFAQYQNGVIEFGIWAKSTELGRAANHSEMRVTSMFEFDEDPQHLIGSWNISSLATSLGEESTIFSPNSPGHSLYISSVEDGIVKGFFMGIKFEGTYGPTTTGPGSVWLTIETPLGIYDCEFILMPNDTLLMTATMELNPDIGPGGEYLQATLTKDYAYIAIPNVSVDVFDKEWEAHIAKVWDGKTLVQIAHPENFLDLEIHRLPDVNTDSFFGGTLKFTGYDKFPAATYDMGGAFYSAGIYGNGIANLFELESDATSLSYYDGQLYFQATIERGGTMFSLHVIFHEKGVEPKDPFDNKYYELKDRTFSNEDCTMSFTSQDGFYVYGTTELVVDGVKQKGKFMGAQTSIGGPTYMESLFVFEDGTVWTAHIIFYADDSSNVTRISLEALSTNTDEPHAFMGILYP